MKKKFKLFVGIFFVFIIIIGYIVFQTHKSVDQVLDEDDLKIKEIITSDSDLSISNEESNLENNVETSSENQLDGKGADENSNAQNDSSNEISPEESQEESLEILLKGEFNPEAQDSDALHRGWGGVKVVSFQGENKIIFGEDFKVTNGPDYMLYLVKEKNVETHEKFNRIKSESFNLGEVKQFEGFQTFDILEEINLDEIEGIVIWCEKFGVFITYANLN